MEIEHRLCPQAPSWVHDKDGFVKVGMHFHAPIMLRDDDVVMAEYRKSLDDEKEVKARIRALDARMSPYIMAKRSGELTSRACRITRSLVV